MIGSTASSSSGRDETWAPKVRRHATGCLELINCTISFGLASIEGHFSHIVFTAFLILEKVLGDFLDAESD